LQAGESSRTSTSSRRPIVVLDTNILMLLAHGVRVFDDISEALEAKPRFVVIKPVYNELRKLANSSEAKTRRNAEFVLSVVEKLCEVVDYMAKNGETVDDAIIQYALENNAIVATNDRELRRRLRSLNIPEAYLREESMRIHVEGYYK